MQTLIVLLLGNSGCGKRSFINTLVGGTVSQFDNDNNSQTLGVNFFDVGESKILFQNEPPGSRLTIIDVPGFDDPNIKVIDKSITDSITFKLVELGKDSIDIVLLFESASSSIISLRPNLETLLNTFGEPIVQSTVGIITKWDRLNDREKILRKAALSDFTQFPLVEWINDTDDKKISAELKSSQISQLSSAINGKKPYKLSYIDKFEEECDSLAEKLRNEDNERFEIKTQCYSVKDSVSRVVNEEYIEYEKLYNTEAEIRNRAEELRINAGKYSVQKIRQNIENYNEEYFDIEQRPREIAYECNTTFLYFFTRVSTCYETVNDDILVTKYRQVSRTIPEEYTDYEYYPIENFMDKAMGEMKPVTKYREKTINEIIEDKKCKDIKFEKYDFLYYKEKARLEIAKNFRNLCKK